MRYFSIVAWTILLTVTLLKYDYTNLSPFAFTWSNVLDILMILVCIVALIFFSRKRVKQSEI